MPGARKRSGPAREAGSLQRYHQKRDFKATPEPRGAQKTAGPRLRFVIQKHRASRLHYDFRLEADGVLKSWAIPKGPSFDPKDKRLAMHVEDHPLDYRTFEGIIPEGNYGAGEVIVWDEGTYDSVGADEREVTEKTMREGLRKGHLTFLLHGKKLRGEFALVRLKKGAENAWLLIKAADRFAGKAKTVS